MKDNNVENENQNMEWDDQRIKIQTTYANIKKITIGFEYMMIEFKDNTAKYFKIKEAKSWIKKDVI